MLTGIRSRARAVNLTAKCVDGWLVGINNASLSNGGVSFNTNLPYYVHDIAMLYVHQTAVHSHSTMLTVFCGCRGKAMA